MGEIRYSGSEFTKMLQESIPGYKPRVDNGKKLTTKVDKKDAEEMVKANEDNLKANIGTESKPVKFNTKETDFNNNKDNLDLEYDSEPDDSFKERVKRDIIGKAGAGADISGNEKYAKEKEKKSKEITDKEHITKTTGLVSQHIDMPKAKTVFENIDRKKTKILNFKNTSFKGENHVFSLIPEEYQKDGNVFIMKDKNQNEYLIEWKVNLLMSEGVVKGFLNGEKINEQFDRVKKLYEYKSSEAVSGLSNKAKQTQDNDMISIMEKVRKIKDLEN